MVDLTVCGEGYEFRVRETGDGWAIYGYCGDLFLDSKWCDVFIGTFEEADAMVLDIIGEL